MKVIPAWLREFIGVPYLTKGQTLNGTDCFGLIEIIYKQKLNIELPDYTHIETSDLDKTDNLIDGYKQCGWVKLDDPEKYCVVLLKIAGFPVHMGLVLNDTHMLHSLKGHDSAIERFNSAKWNKRIEGFYKWQSM